MRTIASMFTVSLGLVVGCGGSASGAGAAPGPSGNQDPKAEVSGIVRAGDMHVERAHYESVVDMLRGKAPGLQVMETASGIAIRIRGMHQSMGGASGQGPLVLVDGMPGSAGSLLSLNPAEVASITVLKDVASTVIYGIRGANGVILVRTRRKI